MCVFVYVCFVASGHDLFHTVHTACCKVLAGLPRGCWFGVSWHSGSQSGARLFILANADDKKRIVVCRADCDALSFLGLGVEDDVPPPSPRTMPCRGFDFAMSHTMLQEVFNNSVCVCVCVCPWNYTVRDIKWTTGLANFL